MNIILYNLFYIIEILCKFNILLTYCKQCNNCYRLRYKTQSGYSFEA